MSSLRDRARRELARGRRAAQPPATPGDEQMTLQALTHPTVRDADGRPVDVPAEPAIFDSHR